MNEEELTTDEFNKKGFALITQYLIDIVGLVDQYCESNKSVGVKDRLTVLLMTLNHSAFVILKTSKNLSTDYVKDVAEAVKQYEAEKQKNL